MDPSSSIYTVSFSIGELSTNLSAKLFVAPEISFTISDVFDYFNLSNISELPEIEEQTEVLEDDDLYNSRYKEEEIL